MPAGSKDDPWQLTTPPGTSAYLMYRDEGASPWPLSARSGPPRSSTTCKQQQDESLAMTRAVVARESAG